MLAIKALLFPCPALDLLNVWSRRVNLPNDSFYFRKAYANRYLKTNCQRAWAEGRSPGFIKASCPHLCREQLIFGLQFFVLAETLGQFLRVLPLLMFHSRGK